MNKYIKYNKKSGSIIVTILNKIIVIEDSGEWIPKDKQEKIFNRFYRIKNQKNKEWFWLWLSLVEKIVNVYNWQIKVESEEGVGTKIILKF